MPAARARRPGDGKAGVAALAAAALALLGACAHAPPPAPAAAAAAAALPRRVAVLPFQSRAEHPEAAAAMRRMFYNFFSSLAYSDVEPSAVDASLAAAGIDVAAAASDPLLWARLGRLLGADAVIVGEVTAFGQVYALFYANQQVGLRARMVACATGETLWELDHAVTLHDGDLPLSLPGVAAALVKTAWSYRQANLTAAAAELCRQMTATIPEPPLAADAPPRIALLVHNGASGPLPPGSTLKAVMVGDPHHAASLSLPPLFEGLAMAEAEPGVYVASYRVRPADRLAGGRLVGRLSTAAGASRLWEDALTPVYIGPPRRLPPAVKSDTVLTAEAGPYLASESVVVAPGATLTLEPGTVVWFERLGLAVRGRLIAAGTADRPIRLAGLSPGGWKGVLLEGGEGVLRHTRVSGAEYGLRAARSRVRIEESLFEENDWGLVLEEGEAVVERSQIRGSARAAVAARDCRLEVADSAIGENRRGGLVLENCTARIVGCALAGNGEFAVKATGGRSAVVAGGNWWGVEEPAAAGLIRGKALIEPVLRRPAPPPR